MLEYDPVTVPNPEVLKAGIRHAGEHIANWNQIDWFRMGVRLPDDEGNCGTTACLAGHILLAQGMTWKELMEREAGIPGLALNALGFERGSDDRVDFDAQIFGYTSDYSDDDMPDLAYTPEMLAKFKSHVTTVTGVEFE